MRRRVSVLATAAVAMLPLSLFAIHAAQATGSALKAHRSLAMEQRDDPAAAAAFVAILPVLHHPRCMNCHSSGDFPRQGDDSHPHAMNVRRGADGRGVTAQKCSTCHQDRNSDGPHMPPGTPDWQLPPQKTPMIWEGLSDRELCELFKDPTKNGNRRPDQIVEHIRTPLVLWGWHPGEGRTPIPMSQTEFERNVKEWAAKGAACPAVTGASPPQRPASTR